MSILELTWTRKTTVAVLLGLSALGVGAWRIGIADGFNPQQFQHTEAIEAAVTDTTHVADGYLMTVSVTNRSPTPADHIVLTARLFDTQGNPLAVNPLVGIQQLAPNDQRTIDIRFPSVAPARDIEGRIEVTLVRWAGE